MCQQPWWTRAWVFQELFVSRQAYFIYGRQSLDADRFSAVLTLFIGTIYSTLNVDIFLEMNPEHVNGEECSNISNLRQMLPALYRAQPAATSLLSYKYSPSLPLTLAELLFHSRMCKASDPRDHVYAFIGIAESNCNIVPDYSADNTTTKVFTEAARSIIAHDVSLDIITHASERAGHRHFALPSWVPDWTSNQIFQWAQLARSEDWAAGLGSVFDTTFTDHGMTLETSAMLVDTLSARTEDGYFTTSGHQLSVFERNAMPNDQVWILCGAKVPFILRFAETHHKLISATAVWNADGTQCESVMGGDLFNSPEGVAERRRIQIR
jgi:hypothetical protein